MLSWEFGYRYQLSWRCSCHLIQIFFSFFPFQIPGLLLITHVVATVVTMTIDPAEPEVRRKHASPRLFDRTAHEHVIENLYCNICQVEV